MEPKKPLIKVVAASVTASHITLYTKEGESLTYSQGEDIIKHIAEDVIPSIQKYGWGLVDTEYVKKVEVPTANMHAYSEKSGIVKFFSVAKKKLASFFSHGEENSLNITSSNYIKEEGDIGSIPIKSTATNEDLAELLTEASTVKEVPLPSTICMSDSEWEKKAAKADSDTTVVAIVDTPKGKTVIPNADALASQIHHGMKTCNTKGVDNLMKRLATMTQNRAHSVQDVLKFVEKGDLPLTDAGDIIIYKRLNSYISETTFQVGDELITGPTFRDCHSGKVHQWEGCLVRMDDSLVDSNRKVDCSHGLHVCTKSYLGTFFGNALIVGILRPEDIIAVPIGNVSKVRTSAYHIVAALSKEEADYVLNHDHHDVRAMPKRLKALLGRLTKGDYAQPKYEVRLKKANADVVEHTLIDPSQKDTKAVTDSTPASTTDVVLDAALASEETKKEVLPLAKVDNVPNQSSTVSISKKIETKPTQDNAPMTKAEMQALIAKKQPKDLTPEDIQALRVFKKKSKKSWKALGIPNKYHEVLDAK
ncbi:MAG: hypothetical protein ACRCVV_21815 [Shewanella sp.]